MNTLKRFKYLFGSLFFLSLSLLVFFLYNEWKEVSYEKEVSEISLLIEKGQEAKTIQERRLFYTQALKKLWVLQEEKPYFERNGKIEEIIGNLFFELEEYPMAIAFYERAKLQKEDISKINFNEEKAYEKLGNIFVLDQKIFFTPSFIYRIAFIAACFFLFFLLIGDILKKNWVKYIASFFAFFGLASWGFLFFSTLFSKEEAIVLKASYLRGEPSALFKPSDTVLPKGIKVEVLHQEGEWALISSTNNGKEEKGFLLKNSLFFIK